MRVDCFPHPQQAEGGVVEELALADADRVAGVVWQGRVKLGTKWQGEPVRVVRVEVAGKELLLAELPAGVAIRIYAGLIAAPMLKGLTGRKPGKRALELTRFYLMGDVGIEEMTALLGLKNAEG